VAPHLNDYAVRVNLADKIAQLSEWRPAGERAQRSVRRRHARRSMVALIGDVSCPPLQMCLELLPALELAVGDFVALDVADPALVLPFLSSPGLQFVLTLKCV